MKFKNIFWLVIISFVFFSCEQPQTPQEDHSGETINPGIDPTPLLYMKIVKLISSEYLNFTVVEKDYRGDYEHLCNIRSRGGCVQELYIGGSPYIMLPNNYYLVDWKWGDIIYEPTNFLINIPWEDVESRQQKWEYATQIITSNFLQEWGNVTYKNIDKYLHITPPTEFDYSISNTIPIDYIVPGWMYMYNSFDDVPSPEIPYYNKGVKHMDSLQNVYIERISQIIEEDALDEVGYFYKH